MHVYITWLSDLCPQDVALVVHMASFLLEVELYPIVEANNFTSSFTSSRLPHKHMFKPAGVANTGPAGPFVNLNDTTWLNTHD